MSNQYITLCKKTLDCLKQDGVLATLHKINQYLHARLLQQPLFEAQPVFDFIAHNNVRHKKVVIIGPTIPWDYPMFQRPQQLALAFAHENCFVLYLEHTPQYADYRCVGPDLYVLPAHDFTRLLDSVRGAAILFPQGIYWEERRSELLALAETNCVIFEYLDHIDEKISGSQGAIALRSLLDFAIEHAAQIHFLATARSLLAELAQKGIKDALLSPNGVDSRHFTRQQELPDDPVFRKIVGKGKPIIGYYGALAPWLDYQLLNNAARQCPEYEFVYIGIDYQHAVSRLDRNLPNCTWLGPKDYTILPHYASFFHAAIIPFQSGDIARSTSPIKLFEYFAMGLPVVVTADMDECTRFCEVLSANGEQEFVACLKEAVRLSSDPVFTQKLHTRAEENTWNARARDILAFATRHYEAYDALYALQTDILRDDAKLGLSPYYAAEYVHHELGYWYPAVQWLAEMKNIHSILDIGGAYGTLLIFAGSRFNAKRKVLLEKLPASSARFQAHFGLDVLQKDVETDVISGLEHFDLVIFTEVIEHLNYAPAPTLCKIKELLTDGGYLLLTTPDSASWGKITTYYTTFREIPPYTGQQQEWLDGHIWQYSQDELDTLLKECGFKTVRFARSRGYHGFQHLCYLVQKA